MGKNIFTITEVDELIVQFLEKLSRELDTSQDKRVSCRLILDKFKDILLLPEITVAAAGEFLEKEGTFIIESFLAFLRTKEKILPLSIRRNADTFAAEIARRPVTARDYDERMGAQSLQFQIDNYYKPKDAAAEKRIEAVLNALNPKAGEIILDIGCGVGTFSYRIALAGAKAIGLDYSQESIFVARQLTDRFGFNNNTGFLISDAMALPFRANVFNRIVCADFIEHISLADKILLLDEMRRVVKKSGPIVIFTPNSLRERLGFILQRLLYFLKRKPASQTRLHFGLTNRFEFERLLKKKGFSFRRYYADETRPVLAKPPILRDFLCLHILWKVWD